MGFDDPFTSTNLFGKKKMFAVNLRSHKAEGERFDSLNIQMHSTYCAGVNSCANSEGKRL